MAFAMRGLKSANRCLTTALQHSMKSRSYCETPEANSPRFEKSINQVTLLGRVGNVPELRGTAEYPVVQFSLATHLVFFKGGEPQQNTIWHRISVFKPGLRELILNHVDKGARVFVQGRLGYYEKKDADSNLLVNKTASIIAEDVVFFNKERKQDDDV